MSQRSQELLDYYRRYRVDDQAGFYIARKELFERATRQALAISAVLFGLASAAGALAGTAVGWAKGWSALAAILPAMATALAGYVTLYAFQQQSKIYGDAARAIQAASRTTPSLSPNRDGPHSEADITQLVRRVEDVLRQEQGQWGQLTSQIQISGPARGEQNG